MAKPRTKWTKEKKQEFLRRMYTGVEPLRVLKQDPTYFPASDAYYSEQKRDPSFKEAIDEGYFRMYESKIARLREISCALATDIYPNVDFKEAEAALKREIDVLKFDLSKLAPIYSSRFQSTQKVEHSIDTFAPTVYYIPEVRQEKLVKEIKELTDQQ